MTASKPFQYDIAISYAGEDRAHADTLANALRNHQVNIFYDQYEQADLWGKNLYIHLTDLYQNDLSAMRREIWGCTATDDETLQAMKSVRERFGYLADPHTAVGILAFERFLKQRNAPTQGIVLGTAHPGKFRDAVTRATGVSIPLPEPLAAPLALPKQSIALPNTFEALKQFLLG